MALFANQALRRAASSLSLLWLGSIGGAAFAFVTQVMLARALSPANYGAFTTAIVTVTLAAPLAAFGVPALWLRLFGLEGGAARRWLKPSLYTVLIGTIVALAIILCWAMLGPADLRSRIMIFSLTPVLVSPAAIDLVSSKLQLEERYGRLVQWQILQSALRMVAVGAIVVAAPQTYFMEAAVLAYALIACAIVGAAAVSLRRMLHGHFDLRGHSVSSSSPHIEKAPRIRAVAELAWPFGAAGVFYLIYFQSDIILLKHMVSEEAAGIYSVAFMVIAAAYLVPGVIFQKFLLPKLHRWAEHDRTRFLQAYRTGNVVMLVLGLGLSIMGFIAVPWLVPLLFGAKYAGAVPLLMVLLFCVPIRFLATSVGATLVTGKHMRHKVAYMGATAAFNIALNLALIPLWGATGAAAVTVASEALLLALYLMGARRHVFGADAWRDWNIRELF